MERYEAVIHDLPGELYTVETDDCKYPLTMVEAVQNQKQTNTGGLEKLLKLKIGAKVMLTVNVDIQDRLINDQTGNIEHIEFVQGTVCKVYVKFSDEQASTRAMR